jgi:hypothetical protein
MRRNVAFYIPLLFSKLQHNFELPILEAMPQYSCDQHQLCTGQAKCRLGLARTSIHSCTRIQPMTVGHSRNPHSLHNSSYPSLKQNDSSLANEFSPAGLLGDSYDALRRQAQDRLRKSRNQDADGPFTGGLLMDFEIRQQAQRLRETSSNIMLDVTSNRATTMRPDISSVRHQSLRRSNTLPVSHVTARNLTSNQTSAPRPAFLRDLSMATLQTHQSCCNKTGRGVKAPPGQPLISLARNAGDGS